MVKNFQEFPLKHSVAIIGGGLAGIMISIELSKYFQIYLIEKEPELGGNLINVDKIFIEGNIIPNPLINLIDLLHNTDKIDINLNSKINDIEGDPGNYSIKFTSRNEIKEINVGAICICTGLSEKNIHYNNNVKKNVINHTKFVSLMKNGKLICKKNENLLIFLNGAFKENELNDSVSNIYSLVNAIEAKRKGFEVIYLYENINTPFFSENLYRMARDSGIQFIRGNYKLNIDSRNPENNIVKINSENLNSTFAPIYIILSNPLQDNDIDNTIGLLTEIKKSNNNYFKTLYNKLYQNETNQKGIFLAGSCIHPMTFSQIVQHSRAASLAIYKFLKNDKLEIEQTWAEIIQNNCIGCKNCMHVCPFNAIKAVKDEHNKQITIQINQIRCRGCGICSSICPTDAIQLKLYSDEEINTALNKIFDVFKNRTNIGPKIITYICMNCAAFSYDLIQLIEKYKNPNMSCIKVTCAGKLSPENIIKPLLLGASGVLILKCPEKSCHHSDGSTKAENLIFFTKELLNSINVNHDRIELIDLLSINYNILENRIEQFIKKIR
ncbi:MAG: hydrogenase iron-sulfur subunit [Candidatus Lokiarchaeota archaeon]|nr:hydrogenase iron-sulfur subunit [Candidatus Lokiarchaeota archaeon]